MNEHKFFLGRTANKARVYAYVRLETQTHASETAEHEQVTNHPWLAISFVIIDYRCQSVNYAGQVPAEDRVIVDRTGATADADQINRLWEDWHLNDTSTSCAHMATDTPAGLTPTESQTWLLDNVTCPVTGARYGSKWWARPLPQSVLDELAALGIRAVAR